MSNTEEERVGRYYSVINFASKTTHLSNFLIFQIVKNFVILHVFQISRENYALDSVGCDGDRCFVKKVLLEIVNFYSVYIL